MSRQRIRRPMTDEAAPAVTEKRVRQQIGQAAGTEYFQNRDPLYHVTESFQMTFDAMGQRHAAQLAKKEGRWDQAGKEPGQDAPETAERMPDKTSSRSFYDRTNPQEQDMLRRFSETSFQRGTLSGAVLRGSGQMMLFSCLKKTVGQNQPDKWQQRKLFEKVSPHRNAPGHNPDRVIVNRGFTDSAVGLVVDTLRDARRVVDTMQSVATGGMKNEAAMSESAGGTLHKMYPFLDDSRERQLLEEYTAQLEGLEDGDPKRSILQNALNRTHALIHKKAQMKIEFINKLRFISDRATEALEVFEAPGFTQQLHEALLRDLNPEEPPDDGGDDDGAAGTGAAEAGDPGGNGP